MPRRKAPVAESAPHEKPEIVELEVLTDEESLLNEASFYTANLAQALEEMSTIINDDEEPVDFSGILKSDFIEYVHEGFEIFHRMMKSIYEAGEFLTRVRDDLKPQKLFMTWLNYTGIPSSTAYQYMRLHDRFREELILYSQLGVKKLLAVAQLENCQDYVRENARELVEKSATEVIKEVREELKKRTKKRKGGRKPRHEVFKGVVIRSSGDGTRIGLENLTKDTQEKIVAAIKTALSQLIP